MEICEQTPPFQIKISSALFAHSPRASAIASNQPDPVGCVEAESDIITNGNTRAICIVSYCLPDCLYFLFSFCSRSIDPSSFSMQTTSNCWGVQRQLLQLSSIILFSFLSDDSLLSKPGQNYYTGFSLGGRRRKEQLTRACSSTCPLESYVMGHHHRSIRSTVCAPATLVTSAQKRPFFPRPSQHACVCAPFIS